MTRVLDITANDLRQLLRDRKIFLFLLIMPIAFTFLFGYAFGGFSGPSDQRLPVGFLDEDGSWLSQRLRDMLSQSQVIRLEENSLLRRSDLEGLVAEEHLAAAIIVPAGYGHEIMRQRPARLVLIGDTGLPAGMSVESEALATVIHLTNAVRTALILERLTAGQVTFEYAFEKAINAWDDPPIRVEEIPTALTQQSGVNESLAHTSPGMMLQFAIAGLLTSAQVLVSERKSRSLQRLLTTAAPRPAILLGHYLSIFTLIFCQLLLLIFFGQFILKIPYSNSPSATLLIVFASALCIAALGLLIGVLARSDEQAVIFSLIPMFVLSGLGGAWVPLEVTGETFRLIGHLSPLAWALDGFKNISIRDLGIETAIQPAAVLAAYAALFFALAVWRFARLER
jgi:ABC-2 type transport system permease protein